MIDIAQEIIIIFILTYLFKIRILIELPCP